MHTSSKSPTNIAIFSTLLYFPVYDINIRIRATAVTVIHLEIPNKALTPTISDIYVTSTHLCKRKGRHRNPCHLAPKVFSINSP